MTTAQYRCLVAYLMWWQPKYPRDMGLDQAIREVGITDSREDVVMALFQAGYQYDPETGSLRFTEDDAT